MASTQRTIPAKPSALKDRILNDEPVSFEEYLERDANYERRLEFYNGWVVNRRGASFRHNVIVLNLAGFLHRTSSGCRVVTNDMRVAYDDQRYVYPDIVAVCGSPALEDRHGGEVLKNPTFVAEVLSPSTVNYDRGEKFKRYRRINTLQTYVVVSQDEPQVMLCIRRDDDSWTVRDISGLDASFVIEDIGISIEMRQLYSNVFDSTP